MSDEAPGRLRTSSVLGVNALAAAWGFAEATVFFIVPDVLLTLLGLRDGRRATWACLWALCGALAGGTVMYAWGFVDVPSAENLLVRIPAIDEGMLGDVKRQMDQDGTMAILVGPILGRPYKIYATYAGATGVSLAAGSGDCR